MMAPLTYKYRLKDRRAAKHLRQYAIALNQVWNYCVAVQQDVNMRWKAGAPKRRWPTGYDLCNRTAGVSREIGVHAGSINEVCRLFALSRDTHKRCPRFRASFGSRRALGWVPFRASDRQTTGNVIKYLGRSFRFFGEARRPLPKVVKSGAFVEDAQGRWWVTFVVEVDEKPCGVHEIGIDLGLKRLATLSNGDSVDNLTHYRAWEAKLATSQRAGNRQRVKAIHAKIANCRRDHHHKTTTKIARDNALIVVGNVSSSQLAKTRMAKSVLDAGWSAFKNMLRYKASRHGACFLEVDEAFTTVTCSACLSRSGPKGQKGLRIREWECSDCGVSHDRDVNAARNILALGRSAAPPVGESRMTLGRRIGT